MFALFLEIDDKATILQCPSKAYLIQDFLGDSQLAQVLVDQLWLVDLVLAGLLAQLIRLAWLS